MEGEKDITQEKWGGKVDHVYFKMGSKKMRFILIAEKHETCGKNKLIFQDIRDLSHVGTQQAQENVMHIQLFIY